MKPKPYQVHMLMQLETGIFEYSLLLGVVKSLHKRDALALARMRYCADARPWRYLLVTHGTETLAGRIV